MNSFCRSVLAIGMAGVLAGIGAPVSALAQGMNLRVGGNYTIGFQEGAAPGGGVAPAVNGAPKPLVTYRVLGSSADQQWYRLRMVLRDPQAGWYIPPGATDIWINMAYVMWVQEAQR